MIGHSKRPNFKSLCTDFSEKHWQLRWMLLSEYGINQTWHECCIIQELCWLAYIAQHRLDSLETYKTLIKTFVKSLCFWIEAKTWCCPPSGKTFVDRIRLIICAGFIIQLRQTENGCVFVDNRLPTVYIYSNTIEVLISRGPSPPSFWLYFFPPKTFKSRIRNASLSKVETCQTNRESILQGINSKYVYCTQFATILQNFVYVYP